VTSISLTIAAISGGLFMVGNSLKGLVASCHVIFVLRVVKVDRFCREILVGECGRRYMDTTAV
jgi:hypothetical protein